MLVAGLRGRQLLTQMLMTKIVKNLIAFICLIMLTIVKVRWRKRDQIWTGLMLVMDSGWASRGASGALANNNVIAESSYLHIFVFFR